MSDKAEELKQALVCVSNELLLLQKKRNCLIDEISNRGLVEPILTSISEDVSRRSVTTSRVNTQSQASASSSSNTSVTPISSERPSGGPKGQHEPSTDQHHKAHPRVVIPRPNHNSDLPQRGQLRPRMISGLHSRAATESWEDGELEAQSLTPESVAEDTSEDELAYEAPRVVKTTKIATLQREARSAERAKLSMRPRLSKPTVTLNTPRRVSKNVILPTIRLEPIHWVFWIQIDDDVGYWRSLSEFSQATQALFKRKFGQDFLQKSYHVDYYARMLRNRSKHLDSDMCVGNITYANRNEPSKWKKARGDKEKACDTCSNKGRFCARMVEVENVVKLGFFPALDAGREAPVWEELRYWVGEKKQPKQSKAAGKEKA